MDMNKKRKLHPTTVYKRDKKICQEVLQFNPWYFGSDLLPQILSHIEDSESECDDVESVMSLNSNTNPIRNSENISSPSPTQENFESSTSNVEVSMNIDHTDLTVECHDEVMNTENTNSFTYDSILNSSILESGDDNNINDNSGYCEKEDHQNNNSNDDSDVENYSNDDNNNDYRDSNNTNLYQSYVLNIPLVSSDKLSPKDHLLSILAMSSRYKLSYKATLDFCKLINATYNLRCLPTSKEALKSVLEKDERLITYHTYCSKCCAYLGEGREPEKDCSCNRCGPKQENQCLKYFLSLNLTLQISNLLASPNIADSLNYRFTRIKKDQDAIEDIYDGAEYKKLCTPGEFLSNPHNFSFTFNTDGCKVTHSSKLSAWPIYVQLNELPPHLRKKHILLAGIFVDTKEPVMNYYLRPFTDHVRALHEEGVIWNPTPTSEVQSRFVALVGSVDTPARSEVLRMKRFNGFFGCTMCYASGKSIGRKHVYPVKHNADKLRTDKEMRADMNKSFQTNTEINGVKGPSALMLLPLFDLSKGMVVDSMHCCFLGVIKWHTKLLLKKDYKVVTINNQKKKVVVDYYIGRPEQKKKIDSRLLAIKPHNIRSRLPRSIDTMATWKASELRNWLDYCVICLKDILPKQYLDHLGLLSEAVNILNSDSISPEELKRAKDLLKNYVTLFQKYFGLTNMTYNLHLLTHITDSVRDWGPFWANSTFVFESWNMRIGKNITSPQSPCVQVTDRYLLSKYLFSCVEDNSIAEETRKTIRRLMNVPLVEGCHNKIVGKGKATKVKPNECEKHALAISGFHLNSLNCYFKGTINSVNFSCRKEKETKFCNSFMYCNGIGFGEILKFVSFLTENKTINGIIFLKYQEINDNLSVSYVKKVICSNDIVFIDERSIISPAINIRLNDDSYVFKVPNSWETD